MTLPIYEKGRYLLFSNDKSHYEVWARGATHITKCGYYGFKGEVGLNRAKAEIERRIAADQLKEKTK